MMPRLWRRASSTILAAALVVVAYPGATMPSVSVTAAQNAKREDPTKAYASKVQPLLKQFCLDCHSAKDKKGDLDLERFAALGDLRKDIKPWQLLIEQIESGEMPPKNKPQPSDKEKKDLVAWVRQFLNDEARARSGDPGHVPLRRLSNAEYDATIRDLTGVDLRPTREFPADGAAGEGFTNASEALTDVSPALLTKYLNAAKDIADRAVLLPNGFRFSLRNTRRDWTDEGTVKLRAFYANLAPADGNLVVQPYLAATVRHRAALAEGKFEEVATKEKVNAKYLAALWAALTDKAPSEPLDGIRARWRVAGDKDVSVLAAEIASWQAALWKTVKVGNYVQSTWGVNAGGHTESLTRQVAADPPPVESVPLRIAGKPAPGQSEVVLKLATRDLTPAGGGHVVWHRPRFEAQGKPPLLLRDYAAFGPAFEIDYPSVFANSSGYLVAVAERAADPKATTEALAKKYGLDAVFLARWVELLALPKPGKDVPGPKTGPAVELQLLNEPTGKNGTHPAISGWRKKGADLPVLLANASDKAESIPGKVAAHGVAVHPTPTEFVAVAWQSPVACRVRVAVTVTHAHPACGNGVAWWLEHRTGKQAVVLGEGAVDLGQEAKPVAKSATVAKGDRLVLAVDARNADHVCDMTGITFIITEEAASKRVWNLAADVADKIETSNPHADTHGNADTWSFVRGPSKPTVASAPVIPQNSSLGRWRETQDAKLAAEVQALLSGPRPTKDGEDRTLYDKLVAADGPLLKGIDPAPLAKARPKTDPFGLPKARFGTHPTGKPVDDAGLVAAADSTTEVRLPAELFRDRDFVVEGRLDAAPGGRVVQFRVRTGDDARPDPADPVVASADGEGYRRLARGYADFRRVFPLFTCFPPVVPTDEVVTLKMFHREDEPLVRMFLDVERTRRLDRLWAEQRFVSRQPAAEYDYLPQFMGFTTQDTPKAFQQFFIDRKPLFRGHAEAFRKEEEAAIPKHLDALIEFAGKAFRRPLTPKEEKELRELYQSLRNKISSHDEAFRGVLSRILVAPAFLFRIENVPAGKEPAPVTDWELATRLSYFLWSSAPDDELRTLADAGKLRDPKVLAAQSERMLQDGRLRSLAIEFGAQWIHVRGFDELNEKNEKLFPTFTPELRKAIYEETILTFQDLFQSNRPVASLVDADHTFLNDTLAKHYGIPGVSGPQWRRVDGVKKHGRGGLLGLASVQAKESGASRTSPILRGNWIVETLLGEKLPRPPANVPKLPEEEGGTELTVRQLVEKHTKSAECATCHTRIDPFGFAMEKFDPIGRLREKDLGGLPIDTKTKLRDGTEFDGLDGLRSYLLTEKKSEITRIFCRRLLGYALGRAVKLSDTVLIDEMVAELNKNEGRVLAAVQAIIRSPQFRMVRGRGTMEGE